MRYHLEKRSKRSWTIVIDLGQDPVTQTRKRRYVAVEGTKAKAEAEAQRLLAEMQYGAYVEPSKLTAGQWLKQWLEENKSKLAPRTYESYGQMLRLHLLPTLGGIQLQKLTASHIAAYKAEKLKTLSPRTVAYTMTILSAALKKAVIPYKLIKENPAAYVEKPAYKKNKFTVLSEAEAGHLLDVAAKTHYYPVILTAIYTGMRLGEITGLKWEDIDLEKGIINVQRQLQLLRETKENTELGPKDESYGAIPIPQELIDELKKLKTGKSPGYVFTTSNGTPFLQRNLHRAIKKIAKEAGFPGLRPHDLRHTCASLLLAQGVPLPNVQNILRHKDAYTTAKMYSHPLPRWQKEAAERLAAAIHDGRQYGDDLPPDGDNTKK